LRVRFDDVLQHNISTLLPPQHHNDAEYPMPFIVFRIVRQSDVDGDTQVRVSITDAYKLFLQKYAKPLPNINAIESYLVEQDIRWLVYTWYTSRKDLYVFRFEMFVCIPISYIVTEQMHY
jgi:nuclear cap-binding protein subunit 1